LKRGLGMVRHRNFFRHWHSFENGGYLEISKATEIVEDNWLKRDLGMVRHRSFSALAFI
jgi:acetolactate synthase regulatory subunit